MYKFKFSINNYTYNEIAPWQNFNFERYLKVTSANRSITIQNIQKSDAEKSATFYIEFAQKLITDVIVTLNLSSITLKYPTQNNPERI